MKIKKIKFLLLFLSIFLLPTCKKSQETKEQINAVQEKDIPDFDKLLKCSEYSYDENYFLTADYGCLYDPKEINTFGNVTIYLLPKVKYEFNDNEIDKEVQKVNHLSIEKLKENFDIYIYLIPKEFLNYNAQGDPIYYQNEKFKEQLFTYKENKWELLDTISINNSSENQKEQEWRDTFIKQHAGLGSLPPLNTTTFSPPNGYYIFEKANLNVKTKKYQILALEKEKEKNNEANWHFNLPIVILNDKNNKLTQNNNLVYKFDDNCPADGFDGFAVKNNYFTIQQISCMDFLFVNSYLTFKIDESTDTIYLHKYGEEYTDRSNPNKKISPKIWTSKDFGVITFEDVSEIFLKNLRNKMPQP